MLVKNRMTRDPVAVSPDHTLAAAQQLTQEHRIRHLPVVSGGELVGILSDRDIRSASPSTVATDEPGRAEFLGRTSVAEVMTREVISAGATDTVEDAARVLCRHRIGALPVVDAANRLLGILTETDVLHAFVEMLGASNASTRLEVELRDRPGELARAVRIVGEDLRLNIGSVLVPPMRERGNKTAILHVATIDPREAIAALEAAGYRVGWPSLEADLRRPAEGPAR
ncbi:MAG: acetoin utilization protein AcuB [Gemmatimonadetes bacterium]|nr:acetoin utilization protein AcuB [Gemmatimonadota bacterium]